MNFKEYMRLSKKSFYKIRTDQAVGLIPTHLDVVVIGYFANQADHKFYLKHSNKCYESDIRNLKSQIEKLKKDRKEPFLTEDQIKGFG